MCRCWLWLWWKNENKMRRTKTTEIDQFACVYIENETPFCTCAKCVRDTLNGCTGPREHDDYQKAK